jgi:3',5'-cyclic AMP phosphodiesterase CpdA
MTRLAHFSDVHLLSLDGVRFRDFVNKRWTGGVNILLNRGRHYSTEVFDALVADVNAQGVEEVVCTGDLTNLALESEFRFARGRFDKLANGPQHVTCVPGNHDNYIVEAAGMFEKVFGDYCASDAGYEEGWPLVRVRGDVLIVGLTTSQPSGWFMAYGEVGPSQLARLEQALSDERHRGKFRVVMLHHPPAGRRAAKIRRGLRDREAFAQVIERAGAELILHGHEHLDLREELRGAGGAGVPVRGIQSASYGVDSEERRARYRIYTAENGRLVGEELRTWSPDKKAFVREAAPSS